MLTVGEEDQLLARDESEDEISNKSEEHDSLTEEGPADQQETNGDHSEESGAEEHVSEDEDHSEERETKKRKLRDAREGKTVFIRNLPFDASEEEICSLFEKLGKIAYCKIVVDHVTEHSRGSAFVKFEEKESAEECLKKYSMDDGDHNGTVCISTQQWEDYTILKVLGYCTVLLGNNQTKPRSNLG